MRLSGRSAIFVPLVARRRQWDKKGHLFASRWLSVPPFYAQRLRTGSREPLSDSPLGYILRNWKRFWPCRRPGPNTNWGTPQKKASKWHGGFCQRQGKESEFPYIQAFTASVRIQTEALRPHVSFFCFPISCSPLSLSDFLDDPYLTFHIHMTSRKGFWGSPWPRSFSYIQKPDQKLTF